MATTKEAVLQKKTQPQQREPRYDRFIGEAEDFVPVGKIVQDGTEETEPPAPKSK